jgi:circadian clock protein KaiC
VSSGNAGLDRLTHGGLLRGSSTLLSGPTGTGKTLLTTQFAAEGAASGEPALVVAYEETPEQVRANGRLLGPRLRRLRGAGAAPHRSLYPEVASLDDHLVEIRALVERLQPTRLVIDSLSSLERLGSPQGYREFVISITSFIKTLGLASMMTAAAPQLVGAVSVTESHISGLIDTIVLLRHVEHDSALKRGILVLRMRGSGHEHQICELSVRDGDLVVGEPFTGLGGILSGQPVVRG